MSRFLTLQGFLILLLVSLPVSAARKITIGYQGIVESHGDILDNTTVFLKFALCDENCNTVYWSNDGTSAGGSEPDAAVYVPVVGGVFNVQLGDDTIADMDPISSTIFDSIGEQDLYLRVWLDDGIYGFEQLFPDQLVSVVPFAVRSVSSGDMVGSMNLAGDMSVTTTATGDSDGIVFNAASVTDGTGVLVQVDTLGASGLAFQVEDPTRTLFSVDKNGSAYSRDIVLQPVTASSDRFRFQAGRIFYDGTVNAFKACTDTACSEISLGGSDGVADITKVTAGDGLTGGGTSGPVTLSVDTNVVVTKSGNHAMLGTLSAAGIVGTTVSATTTTTTNLTASGNITTDSLTVNAGSTTKGVTMGPTGTAAGNTAEHQFLELTNNGTNYVGFKAPDSVILSKIWTLPNGDGTAGQVLETNGAGTLSWATDDNAGGDITTVVAGLGLSGGASSGIASLNVDPGTGVMVNTDSIQFDYLNTLTAESFALSSGQAVFDSGDAQGGLLFEGDTADANELLLTVAEPTTDQTITLPNQTGTIALTSSNVATATALAADPTDCGANAFATAIAASGNLTCGAVGDDGVTDALTVSGGTVNNSIIGGVAAAAGTFTILAATTSITSSATGSIGWSVVAAADQACSTTCTNACVFGQDSTSKDIVDCSNATADVCVCAGAN